MSRLVLITVALVLAASSPAAANILISIDRTHQRMTVFDGSKVYMWPVSTGASGYTTPGGSFHALRMEAEHYSKEWDDAPMPHSIFFTDAGHAIHGTSHISALGTPASHGCVRLAPEHAAYLFKMVEEQGLEATRIEVKGTTPDTGERYYGASYRQPNRDIDRQFRRWMSVIEGLARR